MTQVCTAPFFRPQDSPETILMTRRADTTGTAISFRSASLATIPLLGHVLDNTGNLDRLMVVDLLDSICHRDRCFHLKRNAEVRLNLDDTGCSYVWAELGIMGRVSSREEALHEVEAEFAFLWDEIAQEDDALLQPDARNLKYRMLELVGTVEVSA